MKLFTTLVIGLMLMGCGPRDSFIFCQYVEGNTVFIRVEANHRVTAEPAEVKRVTKMEGSCWYVVQLHNEHIHPREAWIREDRILWKK